MITFTAAVEHSVILRTARAAAWGGAVFDGACSPDYAAERISGAEVHRVADHGTWPVTWAALRTAGADAADLVLPRPGDLRGAPVDSPALVRVRRGPAVLGWLVVVEGREGAVAWAWLTGDGDAPASTSVAEADRLLKESVLAGAAVLVDLDVARRDPEARDLLEAWADAWATGPWPPAIRPRARELMVRAARIGLAARLALADDGGTIGRSDADQRRGVLRDLDRAARTALEAATGEGSPAA